MAGQGISRKSTGMVRTKAGWLRILPKKTWVKKRGETNASVKQCKFSHRTAVRTLIFCPRLVPKAFVCAVVDSILEREWETNSLRVTASQLSLLACRLGNIIPDSIDMQVCWALGLTVSSASC